MGGWQHVTIGDACQLVNGGTPKTKIVEYWDGPYAWITPAEMGRRESPYVSNTRRTLSKDGLIKCSASLLPYRSVILSSRAPIGHLVINEVPMATNQGCKGLIPNDELHYKFLYYYLASIVTLLNDLGAGTTFKELSATRLRTVPIPIPPLPEQELIVTILDEAFAAIATATANAEKNIANARELFESELKRTFTTRQKGWHELHFEDVCTLQRGFDLPKRLRKKGEYPILSSSGAIDTHCEVRVSGPGVVVGRSGSVGSVFFVEENFWPLNTVLYVKNFHGNQPEFVFWFLKQFGLQRFAGGAGVPTLNRNHVHGILVTVPADPVEQVRIVKRVNELRTRADGIVKLYKAKLAALTNLKQSILQKAFSGELTAKTDKIIAEAGV